MDRFPKWFLLDMDSKVFLIWTEKSQSGASLLWGVCIIEVEK